MKVFDDFISPLNTNDFYNNFWRKQPLHLSKQPMDDILSIEEVYSYLDKTDFIYPFIRVIKNGQEYPPENYMDDKNFRLLNKYKIYDLFSKGDTIVIQRAQIQFENLRKFVAVLENDMQAMVNANIYITPAYSSGFFPHFDNHEVFTMQVSGFKMWNIYDLMYEAPIEGWHMNDKQREEYIQKEPSHRIKLEYGDVLYIPRGIIHDAFTVEEPSIHITFGITPRTRLDIVRNFTANLETIAYFRHYVASPDEPQNNQLFIENLMIEFKSFLLKTNVTGEGHHAVRGVFEALYELDSCINLKDIFSLNFKILKGVENSLSNEHAELITALSKNQLDFLGEKNTFETIQGDLRSLIKRGKISL